MKMKKLLIPFVLLLFTSFTVSGQDIIELDGVQSMCIAGKGPGQDGAINPYLDRDSIAIVENIGENSFSIRVQYKGEIIKTIAIAKGETKEIDLNKGYELYFDSQLATVGKVDFKEKKG